jgi:hypothetical protein
MSSEDPREFLKKLSLFSDERPCQPWECWGLVLLPENNDRHCVGPDAGTSQVPVT